ncbi:MAG: hypothetical protein G4V63_29230 [Candidatus Afipia apatlaquensis]|jgi:hypothetical protein|uniref:Uncharacterized protein n=1 Tax=Candidatus Afipia apatlaquensis TaxID=2712852 RepID=A0A7C9RKM9_9BRAD|nr:hypothetical protein [Candidatus Afipia apatlaquensis]
MTWTTKRGKWNWRKFLTADETAFIKEADTARVNIELQLQAWQRKYGLRRMKTVNRAIQRAKFEATP